MRWRSWTARGDATRDHRLFADLRKHLTQRAPEPQRPVTDREHRRTAHASAPTVAQQVGPRLGRLTVTVGQDDKLFAAVRAAPDRHQEAQLVLLQPDVDVDAVGLQEIRDDLHEMFLRLGCAIICFRRIVNLQLC
jgi:hypothetical protein